MRSSLRRRLASLVVALSIVGPSACSSATGDGSNFLGGAGNPATGGAGGAGGGAGGAGGFLLDGGFDGSSGGNAACPEETQYVYVVTAGEELFKFDPPSLTFASIGHINCPNAGMGTPYSMSVDRKGKAWVVFNNGKLFNVDTKTAACAGTAFSPGQYGFMTFGMGFSSNAVGSAEETLFITQSDLSASVTGLAWIDLNAMQVHPVGGYDSLSARAEMTGTGDARLFGAFEGQPYVVAEIDKSNAKILSKAPQNVINYPPGSSNFAFAFWGGDFWLFVGPGTSTDVFQYKPQAGTTTKVTSVSYQIVGAGVSTCAPIKPPS